MGRGCTSGIVSSAQLEAPGSDSQLLAGANLFDQRQAREFTPNLAGTAVVRITGPCAHELVVRTSSADGLRQDAVTLEPNNSPSTATPLGENRLVSSQLQEDEDITVSQHLKPGVAEESSG